MSALWCSGVGSESIAATQAARCCSCAARPLAVLGEPRTSYPLLVVGNTHDPATPISGARRLNTRFDDSVLVTYDGWGHGALGGGRCITSVMADYLVDRTLPPDGTVCRQPRGLFR